MSDFHIECFENEFLPSAGGVMHAVVTVTAAATGVAAGPAAGAQERSELLIVDVSGSMNGKKLRAAKQAVATAIDCIPDGVRFGVIAGNHEAHVVFPLSTPLAVSSTATRSEAKAAVKDLEAGGGTAMGQWVWLASAVFGDAPGIRHAILLTDGKNESEEPAALDRALSELEGSFQCDCRGVGDQWEVAEVRKVATALVGTVDVIATPEELESDFTGMMRDALQKQVADVSLRVWTPQGAELVALKQIEPPLELTSSRVDAGPLAGDYATGSWGDEARDFYLSVRVPAGEVDEEMLAARVTLLVAGEPSGQALVRAVWTDDDVKSARMNKQVADAMGVTEMADAVQEGVDALRAGDDSTATDRLGKAFRMARAAGNEDVIERLERVVEEDPVTGRIRPKKHREEIDMMILEARSTRTSKTSGPHDFVGGADPSRCATCGKAAGDGPHRRD